MAKFKKKRSQPTPDSSKRIFSKDGHATEIGDINPDTAAVAPHPLPADPQINESEKSEKDRKLNLLFWMRVCLSIIAGTAATFIFEDIEGEERRWASIGFMIIVFFGTIIFAKSMRMQLPSSDRKKIVTQAIGSYIFLYLFTWIVTYTLVHSGSASSGINI